MINFYFLFIIDWCYERESQKFGYIRKRNWQVHWRGQRWIQTGTRLISPILFSLLSHSFTLQFFLHLILYSAKRGRTSGDKCSADWSWETARENQQGHGQYPARYRHSEGRGTFPVLCSLHVSVGSEHVAFEREMSILFCVFPAHRYKSAGFRITWPWESVWKS